MGELAAFLRTRGVSDDEIRAAETAGTVELLAIDRLLFGEPRYNLDEIASAAGVPVEVALRYWRALGFADAEAQGRPFTDADGAALREAASGLGTAEQLEWGVQRARVLAASMARAAEVWADALREAVDAGVPPRRLVESLVEGSIDQAFRQLEYVFGKQLQAAVRRVLATAHGTGSTTVMAVGFVDLVGFTPVSVGMDDRELWQLVSRFEAIAFDALASHGGRVVKLIGDEAMLVAPQADAAVRAAATLERMTRESGLPAVRAGIALGPVLAREGDYFGPTVNLASRVTRAAAPGTVVVTREVRDAVADRDFRFAELGTRALKGIGDIALWELRADGQ